MTLNVMRLIQSIGQPFEQLISMQLLPESKKIKPAFSGDDELHLDMIREGVNLTFDRKTRRLLLVNLQLLIEEKPNYRFPNTLPVPLTMDMNLQWIRQKIGAPVFSNAPRFFVKRYWGRTDQFNLLKSEHGSISMLVRYAEDDRVSSVGFAPERAIYFKDRDGDRATWLERRGPIFED